MDFTSQKPTTVRWKCWNDASGANVERVRREEEQKLSYQHALERGKARVGEIRSNIDRKAR